MEYSWTRASLPTFQNHLVKCQTTKVLSQSLQITIILKNLFNVKAPKKEKDKFCPSLRQWKSGEDGKQWVAEKSRGVKKTESRTAHKDSPEATELMGMMHLVYKSMIQNESFHSVSLIVCVCVRVCDITGYSKKSVSRTVHLFFVGLCYCFTRTRCINNDWKRDFWHLRCLFYQVEWILFHLK